MLSHVFEDALGFLSYFILELPRGGQGCGLTIQDMLAAAQASASTHDFGVADAGVGSPSSSLTLPTPLCRLVECEDTSAADVGMGGPVLETWSDVDMVGAAEVIPPYASPMPGDPSPCHASPIAVETTGKGPPPEAAVPSWHGSAAGSSQDGIGAAAAQEAALLQAGARLAAQLRSAPASLQVPQAGAQACVAPRAGILQSPQLAAAGQLACEVRSAGLMQPPLPRGGNPMLVCDYCGWEVQWDRGRCHGKTKDLFKCNSCNVKLVQLNRTFGAWPPKDLAWGQDDRKNFFHEVAGKNSKELVTTVTSYLEKRLVQQKQWTLGGFFQPLSFYRKDYDEEQIKSIEVNTPDHDKEWCPRLSCLTYRVPIKGSSQMRSSESIRSEVIRAAANEKLRKASKVAVPGASGGAKQLTLDSVLVPAAAAPPALTLHSVLVPDAQLTGKALEASEEESHSKASDSVPRHSSSNTDQSNSDSTISDSDSDSDSDHSTTTKRKLKKKKDKKRKRAADKRKKRKADKLKSKLARKAEKLAAKKENEKQERLASLALKKEALAKAIAAVAEKFA